MDEDDEMKEICGPQCWYGNEADPRFTKAVRLESMMELNYKALSIWVNCDDPREKPSNTKQWETWKSLTVGLYPVAEEVRRSV